MLLSRFTSGSRPVCSAKMFMPVNISLLWYFVFMTDVFRPMRGFIAHATAPNAEDAYKGAFIPDELGIYALRSYTCGFRYAILDTSTEPPTLRLEEARMTFAEGSLYNDDRGFVPYNDRYSVFNSVTSGEYTGPGSRLKIAELVLAR